MSLKNEIGKIGNVVFSAGALGGIAFIGAIKAMEEHNLFPKIKGISGCSVGSVISMLYSIGYTSAELNKIGMGFKYKKYMDIQVLGFLQNCGLETGKKLVKLMSELIHYKTGMRDLTFEQHWNITGRELWINSSCITNNKACYYSVKTSPKMSILRAIRRSISIPFLFTTDTEQGMQYVDGGYHDSVPCWMFKKDETVCYAVKNAGFGSLSSDMDNEFLRFCMQITMNMHTSLNNYRKTSLLQMYNVVEIPTGVPSMAMNLTRSEKKHLIAKGYNIALKYLSQSVTNAQV